MQRATRVFPLTHRRFSPKYLTVERGWGLACELSLLAEPRKAMPSHAVERDTAAKQGARTGPTDTLPTRGSALRGMGYAAGAEAVAGRGPAGGSVQSLVSHIGSMLGVDLSEVEIHTSSSQAGAQGAHGMAEGNSVHLAISQSQLGTPDGLELLAHELTHVAQFKRGGESPTEANESEADNAAKSIAQGRPARVQTGAGAGAVRYKKKSYNGFLSGVQEASAIAYNKSRYSKTKIKQIQNKVGASADGIVGPKTVEAIAGWQASHGLGVDGKVGPATAGAMNLGGASSKPQNNGGSSPKPAKSNYLTTAQEKSAIKYNKGRGFTYAQRVAIQNKVGTTADGDIGPKSVEAIAKWQAGHGLTADGKVGPATGAKMGIQASGGGGGGGGSLGISPNASNSAKLNYAKQKVAAFGLVITSTTGGKHTPTSYHYKGRAIDVAGSPSKMAAYYKHLKPLKPTELFYDPLGGIKYGQEIGPIGGHSDHVHVAF